GATRRGGSPQAGCDWGCGARGGGGAYGTRAWAVLSRRQPLDPPCGAVTPVADTVVQARGASLPEFDGRGRHAKTTPVRRPRHALALSRQTILNRGELALEPGSIRNEATLRRCPRAESGE